MKPAIHLLALLLIVVGCDNITKARKVKEQAEHPISSETQFTFLVFDKGAIEKFMTGYQPVLLSNDKLRNALRDSLLINDFEQIKNLEGQNGKYAENTYPIDSSDLNLANDVLKATLSAGGEKYFDGSLHYLFFYKCLPAKFQYKWSQTTSGRFVFSSTFFALLRTKSKELDSLIYGTKGCWEYDMKTLFNSYVFNEINAASAKKIKETIIADSAFDRINLIADKEICLEFLERVIENKWRLVLIDWN